MISIATILIAVVVFVALLFRKHTRGETVDLPSLMHVILAVLAIQPLGACLFCLATGHSLVNLEEGRHLMIVGLLVMAYLMFESIRRAFASKESKGKKHRKIN